jgi:ribosomal protein S18 acetylase RimI-like enzyme
LQYVEGGSEAGFGRRTPRHREGVKLRGRVGGRCVPGLTRRGKRDGALGPRVRELFLEYAGTLGVDLAFQDFERELADLPGNYVALLLADVDGTVAGCAGVREFSSAVGELKRLYVRPAFRGSGLGRELSEESIARARSVAFRSLRLDTLSTMTAATALYRSLGFREIEPYRHNPIAGTRFFELDLS